MRRKLLMDLHKGFVKFNLVIDVGAVKAEARRAVAGPEGRLLTLFLKLVVWIGHLLPPFPDMVVLMLMVFILILLMITMPILMLFMTMLV